ncbi:MAG: hypothetical protein ACLFUJ_12105 [Phycisphaerae bacterium]
MIDAEQKEKLLEISTGLEEFSGRLGLDAEETAEIESLAGQLKADLVTGGGEEATRLAGQIRAQLAGLEGNRLATGVVEQIDSIIG